MYCTGHHRYRKAGVECCPCCYGMGLAGWKRSLGRHRGRWEDNIRMDPTEIGWEDANMVMNLCVPYKAGNFLTS